MLLWHYGDAVVVLGEECRSGLSVALGKRSCVAGGVVALEGTAAFGTRDRAKTGADQQRRSLATESGSVRGAGGGEGSKELVLA